MVSSASGVTHALLHPDSIIHLIMHLIASVASILISRPLDSGGTPDGDSAALLRLPECRRHELSAIDGGLDGQRDREPRKN